MRSSGGARSSGSASDGDGATRAAPGSTLELRDARPPRKVEAGVGARHVAPVHQQRRALEVAVSVVGPARAAHAVARRKPRGAALRRAPRCGSTRWVSASSGVTSTSSSVTDCGKSMITSASPPSPARSPNAPPAAARVKACGTTGSRATAQHLVVRLLVLDQPALALGGLREREPGEHRRGGGHRRGGAVRSAGGGAGAAITVCISRRPTSACA